MKILAIGDLHGDVSQARRLASLAEKEAVDLVVLNGDFTFGERHTPGLIKAFKDKNKQIALLPGNHESPATSEALAEAYGAIHLHGYYVKFGDVGVFGCGSANIGIFQLSEKELYDILKYGYEKIKDCKKKIMMTHMHPANSKIEMQLFRGSPAITRAIKAFKPDVAICSHLHEAEGLEENMGPTKIFSVGKKGRIIDV